MPPCNETNDDGSTNNNNTSVDEDAEFERNISMVMDDNLENEFDDGDNINASNEEMGGPMSYYTPLVDIDTSNNYQQISSSDDDDEDNTSNTILDEGGRDGNGDVTDSISLANDALERLDEEYQSVAQSTASRSTANDDTLATNNQDYDENKSACDCVDIEEVVEEEKDIDKEKVAEVKVKVDTNAVLKAIESIRLRSPKLTNNLDLHSQNIPLPLINQLRIHHPIIPSIPLAAFHRSTPKAVQATHNLSRSASIAECILRLNLLKSSTEKSLIIHVIGVDDIRECTGTESIEKAFSPFIRWMSSAAASCVVSNIDIILCGPTIATNLNKKVIPLLSPPNSTSGSSLGKANATCVKEYYHDYLQQQKSSTQPDLIIFFNPGLWGYDSWLPTLKYLADNHTNIPLVITSYTLQEAEEDADIMESFIKKIQSNESNNVNNTVSSSSQNIIWDIEVNPFHSKKKRSDVTTAPNDSTYYDNYAWQCWKF